MKTKILVCFSYIVLMSLSTLLFIGAGISKAVASEQSPVLWNYLYYFLIASFFSALATLWFRSKLTLVTGIIYCISSTITFLFITYEVAYKIGFEQIIIMTIQLLIAITTIGLLYKRRI